jgi:hypothetical protein
MPGRWLYFDSGILNGNGICSEEMYIPLELVEHSGKRYLKEN